MPEFNVALMQAVDTAIQPMDLLTTASGSARVWDGFKRTSQITSRLHINRADISSLTKVLVPTDRQATHRFQLPLSVFPLLVMRHHVLLALGASAGASATPLGRAAASPNVQVTLHFLKGDYAQPSIIAYNGDRSEVIGHSCSFSLTLGAASASSTSIVFSVDQNGSGNITVGNKEFKVLDDPEVSGGIICGRLHDDVETVVNCEVTVPDAFNLAPLSRRSFPECMSKRSTSTAEAGSGLEAVLEGFQRKPTFLPLDQPLSPPDNSTLEERQICSVHSKGTVRVGNGNPHQNPLHIQLSVSSPIQFVPSGSGSLSGPTQFCMMTNNAKLQEPMQCGKRDGCEIARFASHSYSIGWSASATAWQWLNAGFAVEASIETGNNYACPGNANDYFAVWRKQAQTAYKVRNRQYTCAGGRDVGNSYVMWSPNKNNRGGNYYCVYGRQYVRYMGDRWLDTTPVPGGPP